MSDNKEYFAVHDEANNQYRVDLVDGYQAVVGYKKQGNVLTLDHSEVPNELRGQGFAGILVDRVLGKIKSEGYQVVPTCSYIVHYMNKHPEWDELKADK